MQKMNKSIKLVMCHEHYKEFVALLERAIRLLKLRNTKREYHRKRR